MSIILRALIATSFILLAKQGMAAAFQLSEQNVSGLGRAYAGEASAAEDASVIARNPALMPLLEGTQLTVAAMQVAPDVSLEGVSTNNGVPVRALNDASIAPEATIPAIYLSHSINDHWSIGTGLYSQFGLSTRFDENYVAGAVAGHTEITTINWNVSVAHKINDQFSLAFGLNAVYAEAALERNLGINNFGLNRGTDIAHLEGDDIGYGFNLGLAWQFSEGHRIGLHYRSETDIDFSGDYSNQLPATLGGTGGRLPGQLALTLPAMAELSGSHALGQQVNLHYSAVWSGWRSFDELTAYVPSRTANPVAFHREEDFNNAMRYSLGADYSVNGKLLLRAGIAYDEVAANEEHLSIAIPDTNRFWYSLGARYQTSEKLSVDAGLSYINGENRTFQETDAFGSEWEVRLEGNATLFGLQLNYALGQ